MRQDRWKLGYLRCWRNGERESERKLSGVWCERLPAQDNTPTRELAIELALFVSGMYGTKASQIVYFVET